MTHRLGEVRLLPVKMVCARYGKSSLTLARWAADPELRFPDPIYVKGVRHWNVADLDAWDARQGRQRGEDAAA